MKECVPKICKLFCTVPLTKILEGWVGRVILCFDLENMPDHTRLFAQMEWLSAAITTGNQLWRGKWTFLSLQEFHMEEKKSQRRTKYYMYLHAIGFFRVGEGCAFSLQEVDEGLEAHVNPL